MKPEMLSFTLLGLSTPPSVNSMYGRFGRGLYLRKEVKAFKEEIHAHWIKAGKPKITKPFSFELILPDKTRGDVDNRIKVTMDALVKCGAIPDDRHCRSVTSRKDAGISETMIIVRAVRENGCGND